jgi:tetratricopeptide (TPR) repeat protein
LLPAAALVKVGPSISKMFRLVRSQVLIIRDSPCKGVKMHAQALLLLVVLMTTALAGPMVQMNGTTARQVYAAYLEHLRRKGDAAVFNIDYPAARKFYEEITRLAPKHPLGYYRLANNLWLETLNRSRRLSSTLYSSTSFYAEATEQDKFDPKRDEQFNQWTEKALELARARSDENPKEPEWPYYEGAIRGLRAAYTVTVKRSFRKAVGDADSSFKLHKKVLEIDPNYIDAYLSIGSYEYGVASVPAFIRWFAKFVGREKGSKQDGIAHLESVAKGGRYAQDDARVLLIVTYSREGRWDDALREISYLVEKYPRNYLFGIERAVMLYQKERSAEAKSAFAKLLASEHIAGVATDVVNYQWGEALQAQLNYRDAIEKYKAVIEWSRSEAGLVALSHLRMGQALDAVGRRKEAVAEYAAVLSLEPIYDSHKQAKQFAKKPYVPKRGGKN